MMPKEVSRMERLENSIPVQINYYCDEEVREEGELNVVDSEEVDVATTSAKEILDAAVRLMDAREYGLQLDPYLDDLDNLLTEATNSPEDE